MHLDTNGQGDMGGLQRKRGLAMGSGTQQGRGGTQLTSDLLLWPGRYAQGKPEGLLGGTHSFQGSSGQQGRVPRFGLLLCTTVLGDKAHSLLFSGLQG